MIQTTALILGAVIVAGLTFVIGLALSLLTRSCYPHLRVEPLCPSLWNGMIRSSKRQFLAQSFFDSPDFKVVYDSFYSHVRV